MRRVGGAVNNKIRIGKEPTRDPNPNEGWDDDGEVYDAQDVDDAYYEREGEAEAVCRRAVIEDTD